LVKEDYGQFTISSLFIIITLVMQAQIEFMVDHQLGFDKEQILRLKVSNSAASQNDVVKNYSVIKTELLRIKGVQAVTVCPMPDYDANFEGVYSDHGESKTTSAFIYKVDEDFLKVTGVKLIAGRNLEATNPKEGILINQTAAKLFFEGDPIGMENKMLSRKKVLGVINDFQFNGMKTSIQPLVLEHYTKTFKSIQLKVFSENIQETIASVKSIWRKHAPDQIFEFSFLNEDYNRLYLNETRIAKIFSVFCLASIIIACIGLVGMASYSIKSLRKNLSIRKVFGASVLDNLLLVLTAFLKPVMVSIIIAIPFAVWLTTLYLEEFAHKVDPGLWLFITGGFITMVLVIASIGLQSIVEARMNPLHNLKE
jgi:putative ABC transport system permease protein